MKASDLLKNSLPFLILLGVLGCATTNRSGSNSAPSPPAATPAATPTPTPQEFSDLRAEAKRLLDVKDENLYLQEPGAYGLLASELGEIPKTSKDYKEAQGLNEKLVKKMLAVNLEQALLGEKPKSSEWDGSVQPVKEYLKATLNDYSSSEFVEWSPVAVVRLKGKPYWAVRLKLRAKNAFGAYLLRDTYYFIQGGQVVRAEGLGAN